MIYDAASASEQLLYTLHRVAYLDEVKVALSALHLEHDALYVLEAVRKTEGECPSLAAVHDDAGYVCIAPVLPQNQ